VMAKFVERVYNGHYALPLLDACDAIIVTGRSYAETSPVLSKFSSKCEVIPNGIDIRKFDAVIEGVKASVKRKKNILFVGRLVYPKGMTIMTHRAATPAVLSLSNRTSSQRAPCPLHPSASHAYHLRLSSQCNRSDRPHHPA